ncbi:uncharacterized protein BT62DRAFT_362401 [Guyanagaster necrorhizus]|uniref:Uncharacterized protein n=1 Tax=Guyanagaster necrorhizus TaxID=856835 RepID=A0A9P7VLX7_9AGAR|nr:uncharacterized protein BT62DRAFT_362401 [Guyanagaster necrorhizus MCA 3950]KAG7442887.1 hypothetical protein BT62DRAFT_362401 [Guyanagaster necrorhizus MCA 3950]
MGPDENLASYFNRSAKDIHAYADRIEHGYARPALKTVKELLDEHPISFMFFLFFALLSFFPVLLFLGCSFFVTLSFVLFALSSALLVSGIFIFTFACILIFVLIMNFCIAALPTVALFSAYSVIRLLTLTRSGGRAGAAEWVDETKSFFFSSGSKKPPVKEDDEDIDGASNQSAGSVVVVENKERESTATSNGPEEPANGVKEED